MKLGIVGSGYVGLVTGASMAARGHQVLCVDADANRLNEIKAGRAPFFEPGLDELLARARKDGLIEGSSEVADLLGCDAGMVAVGTPSAPDGRQSTTYIEAVARQLGAAIRQRGGPGKLTTLFVKSTVVPGTTRQVFQRLLLEAAGPAGDTLAFGMMPEFLREGAAVEDAMTPDRVVVGGDDARVVEVARALYTAPGDPAPMGTSLETAELIKYSNNALLAMLVSFSNEIARVAETLPGVDAGQVMAGVISDRRWLVNGQNPGIVSYLKPGCGFGGSCFPKDVRALAAVAAEAGTAPSLLPGILATNATQPVRFVDLAERTAGGLAGKQVLVLGLAFKADTDDVRESPAFPVVAELQRKGAQLRLHDPVAVPNFTAAASIPLTAAVNDWQAAAREADVILLVTSWREYTTALPDVLAARRTPVTLADGRGVFRAQNWPAHVSYCVVGRGR
jgi:UDPglucose 6-dehydrogenase/GDP-mannose 6-dehydrogenase